MSTYKIADLTVKMECSGETLLKQGIPYQADIDGVADITIDITDEKLKKTKEKYPHITINEWEYIQTGFAFSRALLEYESFCLHASTVALDNRAILFSGPCGTGKSTHTGLWRQYFGKDKAVIINDDKPAIRLIDGTFYAYGTPWSGKSNLNLNMRAPIQAIVFLKQAKENKIRRLDHKEAVQMLIYQSLRPNSDRDKMDKLLTLLDTLLNKVPVYEMECTPTLEAVRLVYETINDERME